MEQLDTLISNPLLSNLLLALLASGALITFLNDAVAQLVSRIPVIGGLLAMLVRRASPAFWTWLEGQVKDAAERAVREADAKLPTASGAARAGVATAVLQQAEPGLTRSQAEIEIEAAYRRLQTDAARSAKAAAGTAKVSR